MTSGRAIELAERIIQNDIEAAGPMVYLLKAFKDSRGDPAAEIMMDDVIHFLYAKTIHCDEAIEVFVARGNSIAA